MINFHTRPNKVMFFGMEMSLLSIFGNQIFEGNLSDLWVILFMISLVTFFIGILIKTE